MSLEIKTLRASLHMLWADWSVERTFVTDISPDPSCLIVCPSRVEGRPRIIVARGIPETIAEAIVAAHNGKYFEEVYGMKAQDDIEQRLREAGDPAYVALAATPECEILQNATADVEQSSPRDDIDQTPCVVYPFSQLQIGDNHD